MSFEQDDIDAAVGASDAVEDYCADAILQRADYCSSRIAIAS